MRCFKSSFRNYCSELVLWFVCLASLSSVANSTGPSKDEGLLTQLYSNNPILVEDAVRQIAQRRDAMATDLVLRRLGELVEDGSVPVTLREVSAFALGRMGKKASAFIPVLDDVVGKRGNPWNLKRAAAEALGKIGIRSDPVLAALQSAADAPDTTIPLKTTSVIALAMLEPREAAVMRLSAVLDSDQNIEIKRAAAYTLAGFGPSAGKAVQSLEAALGNSDIQLRQALAFTGRGWKVRSSSQRWIWCLEKRTFDSIREYGMSLVAELRKPGGMAAVFPTIQALSNKVEHGGEGAEVVVLLDVKI